MSKWTNVSLNECPNGQTECRNGQYYRCVTFMDINGWYGYALAINGSYNYGHLWIYMGIYEYYGFLWILVDVNGQNEYRNGQTNVQIDKIYVTWIK